MAHENGARSDKLSEMNSVNSAACVLLIRDMYRVAQQEKRDHPGFFKTLER